MIIFGINLVLQFLSRKVFLDHLGTEVLGLNTTATNLLQFLNLAELGIGTAVGFSLYKPFYDNDTQAISEIVSLQGKLYRRIAYIVIAAAAVLMCFFPLIFANMSLPLWYAYASFGVLLFSALLSYFVNYKQVLLSANQQEYKIQYSYKAAILAKTVAQIVAVKYFDHGYEWWLILEVVFAIIASYVLHITVKRTYPNLENSPLPLKTLNEKYPIIKTKIGQVFFHKIGAFALTQTSPIIIYTFTSLTMVALYGNYMLIVLGLVTFASALSNGLIASIGNMAVEGDIDKSLRIFDELFSVRFFVTAVMCFGFYTLAQPFISLWLGEEYLLPASTVVLITAILYVSISRYAVESYLVAYGFYADIWSPIIEAILNIGFSVLLGHFFGLNGVLSGVLISLVIIILGWKPVFLFTINLKQGLVHYYLIYIKHLILSIAIAYGTYRVLSLLSIDPAQKFMTFLEYGMTDILLFSATLFFVFYTTNCGIRNFVGRFSVKFKK